MSIMLTGWVDAEERGPEPGSRECEVDVEWPEIFEALRNCPDDVIQQDESGDISHFITRASPDPLIALRNLLNSSLTGAERLTLLDDIEALVQEWTLDTEIVPVAMVMAGGTDETR